MCSPSANVDSGCADRGAPSRMDGASPPQPAGARHGGGSLPALGGREHDNVGHTGEHRRVVEYSSRSARAGAIHRREYISNLSRACRAGRDSDYDFVKAARAG